MNATDTPQTIVKDYTNGSAMLLIHEDLARARMRESQRVAAEVRQARRLASARRWNRLARWADRHASEATSSL